MCTCVACVSGGQSQTWVLFLFVLRQVSTSWGGWPPHAKDLLVSTSPVPQHLAFYLGAVTLLTEFISSACFYFLVLGIKPRVSVLYL